MNLLQSMTGCVIAGIATYVLGLPGLLLGLVTAYLYYQRVLAK